MRSFMLISKKKSKALSDDRAMDRWVEGKLKEHGLLDMVSGDPKFPGYVQYIKTKLIRSGFRNYDLEDLTQKIFIRLLIYPEGNFTEEGKPSEGTLFTSFDKQKGIPFDRFFMLAAKRQVANEISKRARDQKYAEPSKGISIKIGGSEENSESQGISEETLMDSKQLS